MIDDSSFDVKKRLLRILLGVFFVVLVLLEVVENELVRSNIKLKSNLFHNFTCKTSFLDFPLNFTGTRWGFFNDPEGGNKVIPRPLFSGQPGPLPSLPWRSIRKCLQGRRLAFIGDSVMRYQYLNLVHFIAHGVWQSSPSFENANEWPSWTSFFNGTTAGLERGSGSKAIPRLLVARAMPSMRAAPRGGPTGRVRSN